jgi:hypothetical protein
MIPERHQNGTASMSGMGSGMYRHAAPRRSAVTGARAASGRGTTEQNNASVPAASKRPSNPGGESLARHRVDTVCSTPLYLTVSSHLAETLVLRSADS